MRIVKKIKVYKRFAHTGDVSEAIVTPFGRVVILVLLGST